MPLLIVADALEVRGVSVIEIISAISYRLHALMPFARVDGHAINYPPDQPRLL